MPKRVVPSEEIAKELHKILHHDLDACLEESRDVVSKVIRLSFQRVIQAALEQEVSDWLGRDWGSWSTGRRKGSRNGYESKSVKTAEGSVRLRIPQVRDSEETYRSALAASLPSCSERLQHLAIEAYARGLSTRDIEDSFVDHDGRPLLSRQAVSELSEELWIEYEEFRNRDLSSLDVVYLFVDGVYESLRREAGCKEGIFVAWGILADGTKTLISMSTGHRESEDAWTEFFRDMIRRGLRSPLLVISDGSPGLINAVDHVFYRSRRQRCIAHKLRNIANKLPRKAPGPELLKRFKAVYYAANREAADLAVAGIIEDLSETYPEAVRCMLDDLDACLTHLEFPESHRKYIRTTNLLERAFVEQKRRTKIIPGFLHERSCLKLVFAVLIRASEKWRSIGMSKTELLILKNIRFLIVGEEGNTEKISFEFKKTA